VASQVYGVPLADVDSSQRRVAKAVNFGVIYGQSPFGLAKALGISQGEAAAFIDAYFSGYPGIDAFLNQILIDCRKQGYVTTIRGRRRTINGVRDPHAVQAGEPINRQRNLAERTAINTVIQGSAADLIKMAMNNILGRLQSEKLAARMLLQIHDELLFEAAPEALDPLAKLVREEMSGVMQLVVPLKVDVKTGPNWAAAEAVE
jgi:DNA polymerase-1